MKHASNNIQKRRGYALQAPSWPITVVAPKITVGGDGEGERRTGVCVLCEMKGTRLWMLPKTLLTAPTASPQYFAPPGSKVNDIPRQSANCVPYKMNPHKHPSKDRARHSQHLKNKCSEIDCKIKSHGYDAHQQVPNNPSALDSIPNFRLDHLGSALGLVRTDETVERGEGRTEAGVVPAQICMTLPKG
jgi:hypothetical protein